MDFILVIITDEWGCTVTYCSLHERQYVYDYVVQCNEVPGPLKCHMLYK